MRDYTVIDIESTGLNPLNAEIIEVSALRVRGGVITDRLTSLVKPVRYITKEIQLLTGITQEMLDTAPVLAVVLRELRDFIGGDYLLGYNLPFDYDFLCIAGKSVGVDFLNMSGVDLLPVARKLLNLSSYKLCSVSEALGVSGTGSFHRAEADCIATNQCYVVLLGMHPENFDLMMPVRITKARTQYGEVKNEEVLSFD